MKSLNFFFVLAAFLSLNSILTAAQVTAGQGGWSLQYNGATYTVLPVGLSEMMGEEMTFECWFQVFVADTTYGGTLPGTYRSIVSRWNTSRIDPPNRLNDFNLQITTDGYLCFFVGGSKNYGILGYSSEPLENYRWYHVAFTISYNNGNPQEANVFLDYWDQSGVYNRTYFPTMNWVSGLTRSNLTDYPVMLGRYQNNDASYPNGQFFEGKMDEVRFWKGIRTAADIYPGYINRSLDTTVPLQYLSSIGLSWDGELIATYNHNEQNGSILIDDGPNRFNGIINGPPELYKQFRPTSAYLDT